MIIDLATPSALARELDVSRQCLANWASRYPDFPAPYIKTGYNESISEDILNIVGNLRAYSVKETKEWAINKGLI